MQAFNYGTAAFEGMKARYVKEGRCWLLFRPDLHYARLGRSAAAIGLELTESYDRFVAIITTLIRRNDLRSDVYIRPLVYRDARGVGLSKPSGYGFSIFIQSMPATPVRAYRCCLVPQLRPVDGSCSAKLSGNYLLSYFAHQAAVGRGCDLGILRSTTGFLSEANVMNLFFVSDGKLFTPSLACGPLDGITRRSIIELAASELGIVVSEGEFRPDRLLRADELFLTGTGSGINYVRQFEKRKFRIDSGNRLAPKLRALYNDATHGRIPTLDKWLVPID